jgi:hypothetical protein
VWADNGDMLSNLYAGTNAIKADFTRTGKRTLNGLFNDAKNSLVRYYLNNFTDGMKQDGMNLLLGRVRLGTFKEDNSKLVSTLYKSLTTYIVCYSQLRIIYRIVTLFCKIKVILTKCCKH